MNNPRTFVSTDELVHELLAHLDERACLSAQLLDQLVVGSLPVADASEVNMHLTGCLTCLNTFARLQSLHESSALRAPLIVNSPSTRNRAEGELRPIWCPHCEKATDHRMSRVQRVDPDDLPLEPAEPPLGTRYIVTCLTCRIIHSWWARPAPG